MTREEQVDWLCRLRADLNNGIIYTPWNKEFTEALTDVLDNDEEPFKGMTNGEVIKALFPNIKLIEKVYTTRKYALMDKSVKALLFLKTTDRWWNTPYKADMRGET